MDASDQQGRWWPRALWVAALLPFVLSLVVHASGVKARPVESDTARDSLGFEQYLVNLGSPPPRSEYLARFAFEMLARSR